MMKKIYFIFIFSLCSIIGLAQKPKVLEPSEMEVQYQFTERSVGRNQMKTDPMILRIGKACSVFLNQIKMYGDSMLADPAGSKILMKQIISTLDTKGDAPVCKTHLRSYVYKNYPAGKMTSLDQISIHGYQYDEPYVPQEWVVGDSIKQVMGYNCQKAECNFRGRHWIVWFASEIPVSDGPWKLNGLPGLILEAYDDQHYFHFVSSGLRQKSILPVCLYSYKRYDMIKRAAFMKAKGCESTVVRAQMQDVGLDAGSGHADDTMNIEKS